MENYDAIPEALMNKIRVMSGCDDVREIPTFPHYAVTITGQVWSVKPIGKQRELAKIPRRLRSKVWKGIESVNLNDPHSIQRTLSIARILLMAYVSLPPFENALASYKDGNSRNITLDNLQWASQSECVKYGVERNGGAFAFGERMGQSKLTANDVIAMREAYRNGEASGVIAKRFGVTRRTADRAIRGIAWKQSGSGVDMTVNNIARGDRHSLAKLTNEKVIEIRQRIARGETLSSIAELMGVNVSAISAIKNGKTWKHVS